MPTINVAAPGTFDASFGGGDGIVITTIPSGPRSFFDATLALMSDGRIVVGGSIAGSTHPFGVLRYLANGNLDTSLDGDGFKEVTVGTSSNNLSGIFVQSDGRIVLTGDATDSGGNTDFAAVRLNANGTS